MTVLNYVRECRTAENHDKSFSFFLWNWDERVDYGIIWYKIMRVWI